MATSDPPEVLPTDRVMAFDPLTATPRRTFCVDKRQLMIQGDKDTPHIMSLLVTDGGKIVMTDWSNKKCVCQCVCVSVCVCVCVKDAHGKLLMTWRPIMQGIIIIIIIVVVVVVVVVVIIIVNVVVVVIIVILNIIIVYSGSESESESLHQVATLPRQVTAGVAPGNQVNVGDTNVLIARVDWEAEWERAWSETLEMERRQADDRERRLHRKLEKQKRKAVKRMKSLADSYIKEWGEDVVEREEERARDHQQFMDHLTEVQRSAEERLSNLQSQLREEREREEQRLAAMMEQHENEKRQQQEQVMTFVLRVEGQVRQLHARVAAHVDGRRLQTVVQRLFDEFNVRFLDRVMAFDPLTATPRRTFRMDDSQLMVQGDEGTPWITSLVVTDGGKIVMTDYSNNKLKSPYQVSADRSGNLYIASHDGRCVLVMGVDGRWRTLLRGKEHGEGDIIVNVIIIHKIIISAKIDVK
nr:hypothetical protein BaRGS_015247 [Batillaria attramentaria]